ncbi:uncharacterized protein [Watersipora subatra]|uniref:uncharacterized protein n=1 Tax=Watersipora subatra TaxID=2589382 RepID=UPI00355BDA35
MKVLGLICFLLIAGLICTAQGKKERNKPADRSLFKGNKNRQGGLEEGDYSGNQVSRSMNRWSRWYQTKSDDSMGDQEETGWQNWGRNFKDSHRKWWDRQTDSSRKWWNRKNGRFNRWFENSESVENIDSSEKSAENGFWFSVGSRKTKHSQESEDNSDSAESHEKHWKGPSWKNWWKGSESESESSSMSSEEDYSWERITVGWCERWCQKWASSQKNFYQLFSLTGLLRRPSNKDRSEMILDKCKQVVSWSGIMCSYNESQVNTTDPYESNATATTQEPMTTTYQDSRTCRSNMDCGSDECCALTARRGVSGLFCTGYSKEGEYCTKPEYWSENQQQVLPSDSCPCRSGLECVSRYNSMWKIVGLYRGDKSYTKPYEIIGVCSVERSYETTPAEISSSGTDGLEANMTTTQVATPPVPEGNSTEPSTPCSSHLDCPFFQCCSRTAPGDDQDGICTPFSSLGDLCIPQDELFVTKTVAACPCQAFYSCLRTNADVGGAYGVCATAT